MIVWREIAGVWASQASVPPAESGGAFASRLVWVLGALVLVALGAWVMRRWGRALLRPRPDAAKAGAADKPPLWALVILIAGAIAVLIGAIWLFIGALVAGGIAGGAIAVMVGGGIALVIGVAILVRAATAAPANDDRRGP